MFEVNWSKEHLEIKYRMVDVDTLICVACQEFLSLIIKSDNWQEELYKIADKDKNVKYNKYVNVYEAMKDMEPISLFNVTYLDLTIINEIIWNCPELVRDIKYRTKEKFSLLLADRNIACHSHKHETPEELYNRGIEFLGHLKSFVQEVEKSEVDSIQDDNIRKEYRRKYVSLIKELRKVLNEENFRPDTTNKEALREEVIQQKNASNNKMTDTSGNAKTVRKNISKRPLSRLDLLIKEAEKNTGLSAAEVSGSKKMRLEKKHPRKTGSSTTNNETK